MERFAKYTVLFVLIVSLNNNAHSDFLEKATIILGRPTHNSITANVLAKKSLEFFIEYGDSEDNLNQKTVVFSSAYPEPIEFKLDNLNSNTKYFYKVNYRENSNSNYEKSDTYYFHTQRNSGTAFKFTIQADPHLYDKKGSPGLMNISIKNQSKDSADFIIDLGDTFGDDHNPFTISEEEIKQLHLDYLPFFGNLCHSSPLFLCLGNHEGESGYYLLQNPPNNLAINATKWRNKYYPNPYPDGFYTGNSDFEEFGIGNPKNYYAFEWGDALFVVLDVYRYYTANEKPKKWEWTIGDKQYFWFRETLENSKSKFKFVFAHHTLGQGRGGINTAMLYEWGGWEDNKKSKWGFDMNRSNWTKPIHQLMVDNHVDIFFQGHDHLFAKEVLDNVIYQEVPMPSDSTYKIGVTDNGDAYSGIIIDGAGYLRVDVNSDFINVDYVKSFLPKDENNLNINYSKAYSYKVFPKTTEIEDKPVAKLNPIIEYYNYSKHIKVKFENSIDLDKCSIKIYDICGKLVEQFDCIQSVNQSINFTNKSVGIYNIIVFDGQKFFTKSIAIY